MLRLLLAPLVGALLAVLASCRTLDDATAESTPYGIQLRERIDQWDRWCRAEKLGPYNDGTRSKAEATCDFLFLRDKRWDRNADEFSRYAHSIKLPAPYDAVQVIYRPGMSSARYLSELCAKEAGEWIFRTVSYQGGILQLRPFVTRPPGLNQLLPHASELIPYGSGEDIGWLSVLEPSTFHFAFLELPFSDTSSPWRMRRYYNSLEKLQLEEREARVHWSQYGTRFRAPYIESDTRRSRYAYAGRGLMRPEFVEAGIYGAELLVVDLETHAVLAFLRNFYSVRPAPNGLGQLTREAITRTCPNAPKTTSARQFVSSVLKR